MNQSANELKVTFNGDVANNYYSGGTAVGYITPPGGSVSTYGSNKLAVSTFHITNIKSNYHKFVESTVDSGTGNTATPHISHVWANTTSKINSITITTMAAGGFGADSIFTLRGAK